MISRLVLWGGREGLDSFRHIHRHYHQTAGKLGIQSFWVDDVPESAQYVTPGTVVFGVDVYSKHMPYVDGVDYVLHNFDGSHRICQLTDPSRLLRLQVYTNDATGEAWDKCRLYDREARTLFQPWGTDLLSEEFMEPAFNQFSREAVYVGAIWSEKSPYGELGNENAIYELKEALGSRGMAFKHYTHIPDTANVQMVRAARIAPAIAGGWQVSHNYLPCRAFKNASYGVVMFTNVPAVNELFRGAVVPGESIGQLVENTLRLRRKEYEELVREQQRIAARYTYRESLISLSRALEAGR